MRVLIIQSSCRVLSISIFNSNIRSKIHVRKRKYIINSTKITKSHVVVALFAQLIIITYVIKFQWHKLYYELRETQRCKNYWNSIVASWVVLRWNFNKLNFVNLLRRVEMLDIVSHSLILRVQCLCNYCICCSIDNHHICYKTSIT